jgi:hypothetical protein
MTTIQQAAWCNLILANIYAAADKPWPFTVFLAASVLCFVASYLERKP